MIGGLSPDAWCIAGLVAVLLPSLYFMLASPVFFLGRFEDPIVTKLFRDLLSFYPKLVAIGSGLGTLASLYASRPGFAFGLALDGVAALTARRWLVARMEAGIAARDRGGSGAIAYNAVQVAMLIATIPLAFSA